MQKQYRASFRLFIAFLIAIEVDVVNANCKHIIAFVQMLYNSKLSSATIVNYLTGIKDHALRFDINLDFEHHRVQLLLKSLAKHPHTSVAVKKIFTVDLLSQLIAKSEILQQSVLYRAIFLVAFHGFFRISNLLPVSAQSFDINKHLARGDVILDDTTAHIIVKWSKTLQHKQGRVIQLTAIPGSSLCPVRALQQFVKLYPSSNN